MSPTSEQITVALDALEADAVRWVRLAGELRTAAAAASSQAVDPAAFSFAGGAVAASYDALRTRMAALIEDGAANFESVAAALRASAAAYEADDLAGAHRMQGIY